jgi:rubrerythrin
VADADWRRSLQFGSMELSVVSLGANLEARAISFYKNAAEKTEDPEGRKVFQWLVDWEDGHLKWMRWLEEDLTQRFWAEQGFSPM